MACDLLGAVAALAVLSAGLGVSTAIAQQERSYPDVPADAYFATPVRSLGGDGVFVGTLCDDGFCPDAPIDRKTMAVWIVRVLDGTDPLALSQTRFNDVDAGSFYASFIERMAELEVTQGCGDGSGFCPDGTVTRAEMAVFISRAHDLPDGPDPGFSDVSANAWYAADAARLAASRISVGCGDGTMFCPDDDTSRAQMATFLWRAENPEWQSATDDQSSSGEEPSSDDEVTLQLSSDPGGDTLTFLGTQSSIPSTGVPARGDFLVPVFLCGPIDHFSDQYMTSLVSDLNEAVAPVFSRQSSGLVHVSFEAGAIVSPDVPWETVHTQFGTQEIESNPCMKSARAISTARDILVVAYDPTALRCKGTLSQGFSFLRVNPNISPQRAFNSLYGPALWGTAFLILGTQPQEPYGITHIFTRVIEDDHHPRQGIATVPEDSARVIMSCRQRRQLGWPMGDDSAPCYGLTPAGSTVSVLPGERSLSVSWTAPTHSDDVPVTGYTLRLYEHEPTAFSRSFNPTSRQILVARHSASSSERSHTFEDLDPSNSYTVQLDLQSRYGRTVVYSDLYRVMASTEAIRVADLSPSGFTLSWNSVEGASRYLSGFGNTYFTESQSTAYGRPLDHDFSVPLSYHARDGSGNSYWTTDSSKHPLGDLWPSALVGGVRTTLQRRYSYAGFSEDQPHWDTVSGWYVKSDWNGTLFTSDQGVLPDTTYTVRIIACRDDGDLIWPHRCHNFASVTVTTPSVSPSDPLRPPDDVQVTAGNTWVDMSWTTIPGVSHYEICRIHCFSKYETSQFPWEVVHRLSAHRFTRLEPSTTYEYTIKSCGYDVGSHERTCGPARSVSVTTTASHPGVAPDRPGPVTARAGDRWVKLEWDEVPNADEYEITGISDDTSIFYATLIVREAELRRQVRLHRLHTLWSSATDYIVEVRACRTVGPTRACSDARAVTFTTAREPDRQPPPPDPVSGLKLVEVSAEWLCHEEFFHSWGQFLEICGFETIVEWDPDPDAEEYRLSINGTSYRAALWSSGENGQTARARFSLGGQYTHTIGVSVCKIVGVSFVCSADATLEVNPVG